MIRQGQGRSKTTNRLKGVGRIWVHNRRRKTSNGRQRRKKVWKKLRKAEDDGGMHRNRGEKYKERSHSTGKKKWQKKKLLQLVKKGCTKHKNKKQISTKVKQKLKKKQKQ